jgi:apolipoprotein N-acyltransferase
VSPGQADPQPAGGPQADVLPGLRLIPRRAWLAAGSAGAVLSGVLAWIANPPVDAGALAFVALIPLLLALRSARPGRGALFGFVFGVVYLGLLLRWLRLFGAIAEWPLVVVESAFIAAFGAIAAWAYRRIGGLGAAFVAAAGWTATEWLRSIGPLGGFTWGGLGYTQHGIRSVLPLAAAAGVWGLSFVVVLVNALVLEIGARWYRILRARGDASRPRGRGVRLPFALARAAAVPTAIAVAAVLVPVAIPVPKPNGRAMDVAIVQGSVPQALASDRLLQTSAVADSHIALNRRLASDPPDLAIWAENALADDPATDTALGDNVTDSVRATGTPTLIGALRALPDGRYANQTLLYDGAGRIVGRYTKVHLVPFGEYVPFPGIFGWTEQFRRGNADLVPGTALRLFRVHGVEVGTPICFENTFPDLFRRFVAMGASLMVVSTNDSSYLLTEASREHTIFSQLRAVETGRWVVQAALSGESALIAPTGQVVARTGLFDRTILRGDVRAGTGRTLYVRFGDWLPAACALAVVALLGWAGVAGFRRRRRRRGPAPGDAQSGATAAGRPGPERRPLAPISGGAEPRVLVVLPTYEERATIGTVLAQVTALGSNIDALVVDDNSPDGTAEVVAAMAEQTEQVRLLRRAGKGGLASAYLAGFAVGIRDGYDVIVEMDADLSHRPEDLPGLIAGTASFDLTIGSRYIPGGGVTNWSRGRLALSRAGNAYARAMLRVPIMDATSGFRAYRRAALMSLLDVGIHSDGYGFQIELVRAAHRLGLRIGEVPILFREREHGQSKISRAIVVEALAKVTMWGVEDRLRRGGNRTSAARLSG